MRFTRISLKNWRNFRDVDIELQRRVFVVGPNASGKSNFLDAFQFLHDIVSVGGGFQEAVLQRGGVSAIRSFARGQKDRIEICVTLGNDKDPDLWGVELQFDQEPRRRTGARPIVHREIVRRSGQVLLQRPSDDDARDPERLTQTHLEQVQANHDFREVADFFASIRYSHLVPLLVRETERSQIKVNDPFGSDFLERIAKTPEPTRVRYLKRISEVLRAAVPLLHEVQFLRDELGAPHLRGRYATRRPKDAWQAEGQFSDGTLRLIAMLWAILDGDGPLLLEEPELSLHPEVIRSLPQVLARAPRRSGRQVLISTHSRDLLMDEGIGLDEVLLLEPSPRGTTVRAAASVDQIRLLLEGGIPLGDVIVPYTAPATAYAVALLGK